MLLSPEYNLELFCYRVLASGEVDPISITQAASGEIWNARKLHRGKTRENDFRSGSRGRLYCDNLTRLISVVMNGEFSLDCTPEFVAAVRPLLERLLLKWQIADLRKNLDARCAD